MYHTLPHIIEYDSFNFLFCNINEANVNILFNEGFLQNEGQ